MCWGVPNDPPTNPPWTPPQKKDWAKFSSGPSADQKFSLVPSAPISLDQKFSSAPSAPLKAGHHLEGGGGAGPPLKKRPPPPGAAQCSPMHRTMPPPPRPRPASHGLCGLGHGDVAVGPSLCSDAVPTCSAHAARHSASSSGGGGRSAKRTLVLPYVLIWIRYFTQWFYPV